MRVLAFTLLLLAGCTGDKKTEEKVAHLNASIARMEQELSQVELKIKDASSNPGLQSQLDNEKENLNSRIARLKEIIANHSHH